MTWWKWLFVVCWTFTIVNLFSNNDPVGALGWVFMVLFFFVTEHQSKIIKQYEELIEGVLKKLTTPPPKETK